MTKIPYWQWLMLMYFAMVAVPVFALHIYLKRKFLQKRSLAKLLIYFGAVTGTAFLMHIITLWIYFNFIFPKSQHP